MPYQFNPLTGNFDIVNPQLTGSEIKTLYEGENNTNAFTDADKTTLDTALQPSDLSSYAPLNNPIFTGTNLTLPNNYRINGIEHFYQPTKPTARGDASSLVVGDRWYNTTERIDCIFEGVNWIGPRIEILRSGATSLVNGAIHTLTGVPAIQEQSNNIFVKSLSAIVRLTSGGTYNESNYWRIGPVFETNSALGLAQGTFPFPITYYNITSYAPFIEVTTTINTYLNDNLQLANLRLWTSSIGSPAVTQWVGGRFIYHRVY